ncbi:MAG: mechanosensitive ion channel domain-containing protein [Candidatus Woesearchaeota archaeon]
MDGSFIENLDKFFNLLFNPIIKNIIVAVLILLIGFIIARILGKIARKVLNEIGLNNIFRKGTSMSINLEKGVSLFITYLIYFISVVWALETLNIATTILYIVITAVLIMIIVSVLLGIKDFFPNFISGIYIKQKFSIKTGDHIKSNGIEGIVKRVGLINIEIVNKSNDIIHIPNSTILNSRLKIHPREKKRK